MRETVQRVAQDVAAGLAFLVGVGMWVANAVLLWRYVGTTIAQVGRPDSEVVPVRLEELAAALGMMGMAFLALRLGQFLLRSGVPAGRSLEAPNQEVREASSTGLRAD